MITFGEIKMTNQPTQTNRQIVDVDIIYSGKTYNWRVYTPPLNGSSLMSYLNTNSSIYENDIIRKEALWITAPKTKMIIDSDGNSVEVPVLKTEIVKPTIPDFEETIADPLLDIKAIKRLLIILTKSMISNSGITQQELDDLATIHPYYEIGVSYITGDIFTYESVLYEVLQSHTSQADWLPSTLPALYKIKTPAGTIANWTQPTGAQDDYQIGDKVTHSGFTWISTSANNVWEPGVYGWSKI